MNFRDRYTPDADLIARKVMAERVKVFTDRAVAAAMTSPLGTLLLAGVQAMVAGWGRALAWLCLINLIELLIIGIGYRHRRLQSGGGDAPTEPGWLTFAVFLVGLAWGSSVWFFWTEGQFLFYLLNLTVLVGVSGICVIVMSPVRMAMSLFTGGILLLPILHLALVRNPLSLEIAAGLAILFVLELQYGRVAEKQLVDGLAHEAYNEALLAELAQRSVALEASKHELDRAQAVGNVGSWSYDIATDIMRLSAETCRIFGLPEGVTGNREVYLARTYEADREQVDRAWHEALGGAAFDQEHRIVVGKAIRWVRQKAELSFAADGSPCSAVGITQDITERKTAEEEIRSLAFYDPLTGLPNRRLLLDRLKQAQVASTRNERYGALLFIDLDNFKTLNDTHGHDVGDLLLQQVSQRLSTCVREGDTVARLGGDEFVVMLEDLSGSAADSAAQARVIGEKVIDRLNQPYTLESHEHFSTPSIGITLFDGQGAIDELLRRADLAMYRAKAAGRNTLRFFDPEMQAVVMARAAMEDGLRDAIAKRQFVLHYQAQVDDAGRPFAVEALLRWLHPERGMLLPAEFLAVAEESGLILPLGRWVLESACSQLVRWAARPEMAGLDVAVNVSAREFQQADFVDQVRTMLERTGADPQRLMLELTEDPLVHDVTEAIGKMSALKGMGVRLSLDDFGNGYSSLSHLKRMPLDQLKIGQVFVRNILTDPDDAAIARMVVALAESMGLAVIAEGVETGEQKDLLASLGCDLCQGFYFSQPLPVEGFERFALTGKSA